MGLGFVATAEIKLSILNLTQIQMEWNKERDEF
jgi:hypothetical protein